VREKERAESREREEAQFRSNNDPRQEFQNGRANADARSIQSIND